MKTKFLRMKHVIRTLNDDGTFEDKHYMFGPNLPSISAAKRASRALQNDHGGMGRGSLRVVEKLPSGEEATVGLRDDELDIIERYKTAALV